MGMFDLPANPWQPQTNIATKLRELYVRLGLLGNNRQQDIQNAIQDPAGVAERLAGTVNEYIQDPMSYVGGGIGHIAYHGSPYKFDKFSLDKIGTGEGAQAYGHGLYLAEAPDVAKSYQALHGAAELRKGGNRVAMYGGENKGVLDELARHGGNFDSAIASQEKLAKDYNGMFAGNANKIKQTLEAWKANGYEAVPLGNMYKTDIPDEAVARFLDWDKPLSQQGSVEIRKVAPNYDGQHGTGDHGGYAWHIGGTQVSRAHRTPEAAAKYAPLGNEVIRDLNVEIGRGTGHQEVLQKAGIPGIRYLDGGSRSGGAGTSNFVAFDPEMIRILERNGIPTGNQPWKPGEFNIFKDTTESAPLFRDTTR